MLSSLEPMERYIIGGYIKRGDNTVVDIAVEAIGTPESIRKAISTVRRTMTSYTPDVTPITITANKTEALHVTVIEEEQVPAGQESTKTISTQGQEPNPQPAQASVTKIDKPPEGVRGLVRLHCPACGSTFGTFLRERQSDIACKCGHHIDLTVPLAGYHFTCPYCEKETWGRTNLEDPDITIKCKCGSQIDLQWVPKAKEYQN